MMRACFVGVAILGLGLALTASGQAPQTTSLSPVADTYLEKGPPNRTHGTEPALRLEKSNKTRVLVRFDQDQIAAAVGDGQLLEARLRLFVVLNVGHWADGAEHDGDDDDDDDGQPVDVHRLTRDWTEPGATWNCPVDTNPGNNKADCSQQWGGGSFSDTRTDTVFHTEDTAGWVELDVTTDVAAFLAGQQTNLGWLIKQRNNQRNGRVDYASRQGTAGLGPQLVLTWQGGGGGGDVTPPVVTFTAPAEGALLTTATPTVSATLADDSSGVDAASVRLLLDGLDRTAEATVSAAAVSFTPSSPLAEGSHSVEIVARDLAGNETRQLRSFRTDTQPPGAFVIEPSEPVLVGDPQPHIEVVYPDDGSAADLTTLVLTLDGADVLPRCTVDAAAASCLPLPLSGGPHTVVITVRDLAGHEASDRFDFELQLDLEAPTLTLTSPGDGFVTREATVTLTGTVSDDEGVTSFTINGSPVSLSAGAFSVALPLLEGTNPFLLEAGDAAGNGSSLLLTVTRDTQAPALAVTSPAADALVNTDTVTVTGEASDNGELASVTVAGAPASLALGRFEAVVPLSEGTQTLTAVARDAAGNESQAAVSVRRLSLLEVVITSPANLATLASTVAEVRGTTSEPAVSVVVRGVAASVSGNQFTAVDVPLTEGGNLLTATATDAAGRVGTATVNVVRDLTPPHLSVYLPRGGTVVRTAAVDVAGLVNDLVPGTVNATEATVTVNGLPAQVANRAFLAPAVPLALGDNALTVRAVDESGNVTQTTVTVRREAADVPRLVAVSGNLQTGTIGEPLASPLVVAVVDAAGSPLAGRRVIFEVTSGNGALAGDRRGVAVTTDAAGQAAATWTLGTRAGVGNQRVEATAVGFAGPVTFTVVAENGPPSQIFVDAGGQQIATAGHLLPRPLIATVTDSGFNRLPGVAVRFQVVVGNGHFGNGLPDLLVLSDSDGRALAPFVLDPTEGIDDNVVVARIEGLLDGPTASFSASGWAAGDPAETVISGRVLDNQDQPVPGVSIRVRDTVLLTQTDAEGLFRLPSVPIGTVELIVDGSTATVPGSWPDLEFVVTTVPGRDNTVGMPIYLLPLDLADGIFVDETTGGTLTLAEMPGFALEVAPGSVTFPGGGRSGLVSVTVVHSDKVPMVPNFGQQPRLIVTIQPAGARFDPPARLVLPNVDGLAPGEVTELYSFDHDLGHFVSIGPATVSRDGSLVVANPGVGIVKAGWHCGGNPSASGTTHDCPTCQVCTGSACEPDPAQEDQPCGNGDHCQVCNNGTCGMSDVQVTIDPPPDNANPSDNAWSSNFSFLTNADVEATATLSGDGEPDEIEWELTDLHGDHENVQPADMKGTTLTFRPKQEPPEPRPYVRGTGCGNPGNGSCQRSLALSYKLKAKYCEQMDEATITQDQRDIIRQEYVNHGLNVPARGDFNAPSTQANYGPGDVLAYTAYTVVLGTPEVLAQNVYNELNRLIHDDVQVQPVGRTGLAANAVVVNPGAAVQIIGAVLSTPPCFPGAPNSCDDVRQGTNIVAGPNGIAETMARNQVTAVRPNLNSAWRNPQRNEAVNGVLNSNHQLGNAVDLGGIMAAEGLTRAQLICILQTAGDNIGANAFAEIRSQQADCNNAMITHVHVQQ